MSLVGYVTRGDPDVLRRRARTGLIMIPVLMAVAWLLMPVTFVAAMIASPSMGGRPGDVEIFLFLLTLVRLLPLIAALVALVRLLIARRGGAELGVSYVIGAGLLFVPAVAMFTLGVGADPWSVAGLACGVGLLAVGILVRRRGT